MPERSGDEGAASGVRSQAARLLNSCMRSFGPVLGILMLCAGAAQGAEWKTGVVDKGLYEAILHYAQIYYRDTWKMTRAQYMAWILTIARTEGRDGSYAAHSWASTDSVEHVSAPAFRFCTGVGPFQLDRGGDQGPANERWCQMPTIHKMDPRKAVESVMRFHYDYFSVDDKESRQTRYANLALFQDELSSVWFGLRDVTLVEKGWRLATNSDWKDSKDDVNEAVEFRPQEHLVEDRWDEVVQFVGNVRWDLAGDGRETARFVGYWPTYLIVPRGYTGKQRTGMERGYYYTWDSESGWEVWVWNDPDNRLIYRFERKFAHPHHKYSRPSEKETPTGYLQWPEGLNCTLPCIPTTAGVRVSPGMPSALNPNDREDPLIKRALDWLRGSQREDGSWSGSTGITALVLLGFLNAGVTSDDPAVSKGLALLAARFEHGTGRFREDQDGASHYFAYATSLSILALVAAEDRGRPRSDYRDMIAKARDYLLSIQYRNPDNPDDPRNGGWGYPLEGWTDLSNTQWVVMALDAAYDYLGEAKPPPAAPNSWTGRLLRYLEQCQNADGGFAYQPGGASWGSMSAAGLWSLVLAGVDTSDARVTRVTNWISRNYRLDVNPGRASAGLYYYYVTFAKALMMADLWEITTPDGQRREWSKDLRTTLEGRQSSDGYWVNSDTRVQEGNGDLCTAYAILALQVNRLPSDKPLSWVLTLHSPAELHVYDWLGRHVGRNEKTGKIDTEIPGSSYSVGAQGEQIVTLALPQAGRYRIEVVGTGTGSFTLDSRAYLGERTTSSDRITGTISAGQVKATTATLTSMVGPLTVYIGELQSVPHGLVAVAGKGSVDLSWNSFREQGFGLAGYAIYRSTTSRLGYAKISTVPGQQTSYRDTAVVAGTTYYYVITAIGSGDQETPYSREASATPLGTFEGAITVGPNPVGGDGCAFFYVVPDGSRRAAVLIFDVTGRKVQEISLDPAATRYPSTGRWSPVNAAGLPLANGPYIYVLVADDRVIGQGKMVIQR